MTVSEFPPHNYASDTVGDLLTFIVPAFDGCNLRCSFCLIRQRQEITENSLSPSAYARFIRDAALARTVVGVAIQGYEPLLPAAMPYTTAILAMAREAGIPSSLVTNGVLLGEAAPRLMALAPCRIGVSIDAASSERHDRIRGVPGAWSRTVSGIERALGALSCEATELVVLSVLLPGRSADLEGMPRLLQGMGVRKWIVSPLVRVGRTDAAPLTAGPASLVSHLRRLAEQAARCGVALTFDDELGLLRRAMSGESGSDGLPITALPEGVTIFRLLPSGHCSVRSEIMRRLDPNAPRWNGRTDAAQFLAGLAGRGEILPCAA